MALLRMARLAIPVMIASAIRRRSENAGPHGYDESQAALGQAMQGQWVEASLEYKGKRMIFPINPDELQISRSTGNTTREVLELGEVVLPGAPNLERINFKSQFWHDRDENPSESYLEWLKTWRDEKEPGRLVIANNNPESAYHGYNKLVLCSSFDTNEGKAGNEDDIYYALNLIEYREGMGSAEAEVEYDPVTEEPYVEPLQMQRPDDLMQPSRLVPQRWRSSDSTANQLKLY